MSEKSNDLIVSVIKLRWAMQAVCEAYEAAITEDDSVAEKFAAEYPLHKSLDELTIQVGDFAEWLDENI